MQWYFARQGQHHGPFYADELLSHAREGLIRDETLVWRRGMSGWIPYMDAKSLLGEGPPPLLRCAECGRGFDENDLLRYGKTRYCADCKPLFLQRMRAGLHHDELPLATLWQRTVARILDWSIQGVFSFAVYDFVHLLNPSAGFAGFAGFIQPALMLMSLLYDAWFVANYGATPGKMALGLKVVRTNGEQISPPRALGRAAGLTISTIFCYLGFFIAFINADRKTLHDMFCDTRVVENSE